jgi:hypothetical protein
MPSFQDTCFAARAKMRIVRLVIFARQGRDHYRMPLALKGKETGYEA